MVTDKKPSNVVEALAAVMAELPAIGKDSKAAPQQGGYAYRGIEAITQVVQPLFAKHGVIFAARVMSYEIRDIVVNDKPWTDTVALIAYDVYGPGGIEDCITVGPFVAIGRDNSDKGGNKCATQAFKYALIQTLCISDSKDDGDAASHEAAPVMVDPLKAKRAELGRVAEANGITTERAKELLGEWFGEGVTSADLDVSQLDTAILGMKKATMQRTEATSGGA